LILRRSAAEADKSLDFFALVLSGQGSSLNGLERELLGNSEYLYAENELLFRKTSAGFGQKSQEGRETEAQA
jgi:hypothetical protein